MELLKRLENDHRRFRGMIEKLDAEVLDSGRKYDQGWCRAAGESCSGILGELLPALERHESLERRFLFPELARRAPAGVLVLAGLEREHAALDKLLAGFLEELPRASDKPTSWMILNLLRLTGLLQRHMAHEEEEIFSAARRYIPRSELLRLGREAPEPRTA